MRGQWVPLRSDTVPLGTGHHLADLQLDEFQPVRPDLAVELDRSLGNQSRRVELLVELDRSGRPSSNYDKFRRYDALLNGWATAVPRYKALGEPPVVVFVVEDDDKATQLLRAADRIMTGRVGKWGVPEAAWPAYGRPADLRRERARRPSGDTQGAAVARAPPTLRKALGGRGADRLQPEQVASLLPKAFLR